MGCVRAYERRPALIEVWLRGRVNPRLHAAGRERNREVSFALLQMAVDQGLCRAELPPTVPTVAVETGDRLVQLAFESSYTADRTLLVEYIAMMRNYLGPWVADAPG